MYSWPVTVIRPSPPVSWKTPPEYILLLVQFTLLPLNVKFPMVDDARLTQGMANSQSAANAGSLVQARDKDAARAAGNRHGKPDRRDLHGVGFMGLWFMGLIQVAWRESG
jgi:hypothetical protein